MYKLIDGRLEKIESKMDTTVKHPVCKAIRESCGEKIELKLKNLKLWVLALLASCGLNVAGFIYNVTGADKKEPEIKTEAEKEKIIEKQN
jgi:hypothetical protein